jgi:hypothetical protein
LIRKGTVPEGAGERARQDADKSDADLDGREKPSGLLRQLQGGGGAGAPAVDHRLQAGLAADTMASSDRAKRPFRRIRRKAMPSSSTGHSGARGTTPRLSILQRRGSGRNPSSDEHPQLVEKGANAGDDRRGHRRQDQDAAHRREPADEGGHAIPLQDAEGKGRDRAPST